MLKCADCKKPIVEITKVSDWYGLFHFVEFLSSEEMITEDTYQNMIERLMTFKAFAMDWDKNTED